MRPVVMSAAALLWSSLASAQTISFVEPVGGSSHVFLDNLADDALTQLTSGPDTDQSPEWSFDGSELAFERDGPDVGYAVMVMNANGSGLLDISPPNGADILPSWTQSGQIVFSQVIEPPNPATMNLPVTALMIMNADGSGRTALVTPGPQSMFNFEPMVSPDGTKILFECGPAFNSPLQVCEVNSNGTGFKYLTSVQGAASSDAHWSSDESKIIFDSTRAGGVNLFSMNPNGSDVTQLTQFAEPLEGQDAGYSPDGSSIVFEWDNGGNESTNAAAPAAVWTMGPTGLDPHPLSIPCAESGCAPRYQPDPSVPGPHASSGYATAPEAHTWTMILIGFAAIGFAARSRAVGRRGDVTFGAGFPPRAH